MKKLIFILLFFLPQLVFSQCPSCGKVILNKASGGTISWDTINAFSQLNLKQTTAGQTISLANMPTGGKLIYVRNLGSVSVTISPGGSISPGQGLLLGWTGLVWNVTGTTGVGTFLPLAGGTMTGSIVMGLGTNIHHFGSTSNSIQTAATGVYIATGSTSEISLETPDANISINAGATASLTATREVFIGAGDSILFNGQTNHFGNAKFEDTTGIYWNSGSYIRSDTASNSFFIACDSIGYFTANKSVTVNSNLEDVSITANNGHVNIVSSDIAISDTSLLISDGSYAVKSLPNASGVLTNDGSGAMTWEPAAVGTVTAVTGTTNRITSSGGATPALDISASYIGQSSITTLGTITTGVWNGAAIANGNLANSAVANLSGTNTGDQTSVTGNAGSATTTAITDDASTNATMYPTWVTTTTGNLPQKVSSTKLTFNPSTGNLSSTLFTGPLTGNVTGNVSGSSGSTTGNAATVTTNANLTGPITSSGNATAIAAQTGTGTTFVMQASPTLTTPNIGTPSAGVLTNCTGYTGVNLVLTDVTTNNASTSAHGFAPKYPNDATKYLDGTGAYTTPGLPTISGDATNSGNAVTLSEQTRWQTVKVSLSSAQIKLLNSTPQIILAAPGAGKIYVIDAIYTRLNFGTLPYAVNTTLVFQYTGATINLGSDANTLIGTVSKISNTVFRGPSAVVTSTQLIGNTSFEVNVSGGNPTTGDGTIDVYVTYKILTL